MFTSESVTEGHPDKMADQISDAILDEILASDPDARVACETLVSTGLVVLAGEITTTAHPDFGKIVRETVQDIGYDNEEYGFSYRSCAVLTSIGRQSGDISRGVGRGGAGDQGMMFGYATNETRSMMPLPIAMAHALTRKLAEVRRDGTLPWLRPDGKSQVTVEYDDGEPLRVRTVVLSAQHDPSIGKAELTQALKEHVIHPVIPEHLVSLEVAHTGLTDLQVVGDMHLRKARMMELGDAFVALPGGAGTLEEWFEVFTWKMLRLHAKRCAFLDIAEFYGPLLEFVGHATTEGFIPDDIARDIDVYPSVGSYLEGLRDT
mgnify:CR=1 FL=1